MLLINEKNLLIAFGLTLTIIIAIVTGCKSSISDAELETRLFGEGLINLKIVPGDSTIEPSGVAGEAVGQAVVDSIVEIELSDIPINATVSIVNNTATFEEVCVSIDLCDFYNVNEIGSATQSLPEAMALSHFASVFSWTVSIPVIADGEQAGIAVINVEPQKFESLTPLDLCPRDFCTEQPFEVNGEIVSFGTLDFVGQIAVEMDIAGIGGADVSVDLTGEIATGPIVDSETGVDITALTLP